MWTHVAVCQHLSLVKGFVNREFIVTSSYRGDRQHHFSILFSCKLTDMKLNIICWWIFWRFSRVFTCVRPELRNCKHIDNYLSPPPFEIPHPLRTPTSWRLPAPGCSSRFTYSLRLQLLSPWRISTPSTSAWRRPTATPRLERRTCWCTFRKEQNVRHALIWNKISVTLAGTTNRPKPNLRWIPCSSVAPHRKPGPVLPENILLHVCADCLVPPLRKRMKWICMFSTNQLHSCPIILNSLYVYNLHQKNGFTCMLLGEIFELVYVSSWTYKSVCSCLRPRLILFSFRCRRPSCSQLLFVVGFTVFLANCVDYDILFANKFVNHTDSSKVTLPDAFLPVDVCSARWASHTGVSPSKDTPKPWNYSHETSLSAVSEIMRLWSLCWWSPGCFGFIAWWNSSTMCAATGRSGPSTLTRWRCQWWAGQCDVNVEVFVCLATKMLRNAAIRVWNPSRSNQ